ncbi:nucleotide exchange factor GrpE [candidate division WWE3 bacterium]|uniref:Protein GrpE n=1 Tax=candidate division WWE3 bacterium TaxID=2053526 RepID=A0A7X9HSK2_UNCKA|nr:nucleotide exchange factor GrpE [candidate division WWE3 bacterium]
MKEVKDKKIEELEKCQKHIKHLEGKVKDLENNWKRALADYKNLEKRVLEDKEQLAFYIKKQTIEDILPFLDNLEKIGEHIKDKGLELTLKDFKQTLSFMGVEEIKALGKDFNSNEMEAVETGEGEKDKVLKVLSNGYLLNGKLLRPAKVVVGK